MAWRVMVCNRLTNAGFCFVFVCVSCWVVVQNLAVWLEALKLPPWCYYLGGYSGRCPLCAGSVLRDSSSVWSRQHLDTSARTRANAKTHKQKHTNTPKY